MYLWYQKQAQMVVHTWAKIKLHIYFRYNKMGKGRLDWVKLKNIFLLTRYNKTVLPIAKYYFRPNIFVFNRAQPRRKAFCQCSWPHSRTFSPYCKSWRDRFCVWSSFQEFVLVFNDVNAKILQKEDRTEALGGESMKLLCRQEWIRY